MATGTFCHNSYRKKNLKNAHKNAQKNSKNFNPDIRYVASIGANFNFAYPPSSVVQSLVECKEKRDVDHNWK